MNSRGEHIAAAFAAAQSLCQQGRFGEADALCADVLRLDPQHVAAHHLRGHLAMQRGDYVLAVESIGNSLKIDPNQPYAHFSIANACMATGELEQALQSYDRALKLDAFNVHALNNRGLVLAHLGRPADALGAFEAALAIDGSFVSALQNRAAMLARLDRPLEAVEAYAGLLHRNPKDVSALFGQGNVMMALHRFEEATESFTRVLELETSHGDARLNRGVALHHLRRLEAALADYEHLLRLVPNSAVALANSANLLMDLGRPHEALQRYEMAGLPASANNHCGRGMALLRLGSLEQAGEAFERALALEPGHAPAREGLFRSRIESCDWSDFDSLQQELKAEWRRSRSVAFPLSLLLFDDPELSLQCMRNTVAAKYPQRAEFATLRSQLISRQRRKLRQRIRVAYVSADFREHPVARLLVGVLERHDRERFEVLGVSLLPGVDGEFDRRLRSAFDTYLEVGHLTDTEIAQAMRDQEVDIAVDLMGMTEGLRPSIFAHGAAAVQVSYLGYAGTMGAPYIDYLLADPVVIPEGLEHGYDERMVRLPGCFLPYDDRREAGSPPSRQQAGLPEQGFVYCAFTQPHKITPAVFRVWMGFLRDVPGSVLWLREMGELAGNNLRRFAQSQGIAAHRLVFAPRLNKASDHVARQALADLYLDTLPYNAHSTACDALWAGVPVLTCAGNSFASRVAASALAAVGLQELVARNLDEYQQLGRELSRTPERLRVLRNRLAEQRGRSRLFDTKRHTRSLEAAYLSMHERAHRGESPMPFSIRD